MRHLQCEHAGPVVREDIRFALRAEYWIFQLAADDHHPAPYPGLGGVILEQSGRTLS